MKASRRAFVVGGTALTAAAATGWSAWQWRDGVQADRLSELLHRFNQSSNADLLRVATDALKRGATQRELADAAFLLPLVTAANVGDVHSMLVIPAVLAQNDLPSTLWAIENAHDWSHAVDEFRITPAGDPDALRGALGAGDEQGAATAAAALADSRGADHAMSLLRLEASLDRADPHGTIYAMQASRMCPGLDHSFAREVVVAVASYLARTGPAMDHSGTTPEDWNTLATWCSEIRLADDAPAGGLGVHATTLLNALYFAHQNAPAKHQGAILLRATERLQSFHRATVRGPGKKPNRSAPAPDVRGSDDVHAYKYVNAIETLSPVLSPSVRSLWHGAARSFFVRYPPPPWPRLGEAKALIKSLA